MLCLIEYFNMKTFAIEDIFADEYLKLFFIQRDLGESSRNTYLIRLKKYCEYTQKTPSELIEEAEAEQEENIKMRHRKINRYLLGFKEHMREEGRSFNSIKTYMATIKGFYTEFDIDKPRIKLKDHEERQRTTTQDIVGKKHIKQALKHANIKYKAIILMMSSSGMGTAEIIHLTWENFLEAIQNYLKPVEKEQFDLSYIIDKLRENRNLILTWQIRRYKTGHPYITFTSPEANRGLLDYLEQRNRENKPVESLDDPLFLSYRNMVDRNTLMKYFAELNDTCEFGFQGKNRFFTSHKLRKFFASTLNTHRVPVLVTRWLMGHDVDKTVDAYFKPDLNSLKSEYTRLIPYLSIEDVELKAVTSKEYDELLRDSREKGDKITSMERDSEKKDEQISKLEKKQGVMEKMLEELMEKQIGTNTKRQ